MKIIDAHVHYSLPIRPADLIDIVSKTKAEVASLVMVPSRSHISSTPEAFMVKRMMNDKYYVFSNLDVSRYFINKKNLGKKFVKYTKKILACGADGIKIIEGKPNMRKELPVPDFDLPVWDPFFSYCEDEKVPILWHVNDPEDFWDLNTNNEIAIKNGWVYDETYINNEVQYNQIYNLLDHHPNLKIIFAHFFFMSNQLSRLASILDKYPNVCVDLTPGIEMYKNFSANILEARAFFVKYQDRIIYGSDIAAHSTIAMSSHVDLDESIQRTKIVQTFLSGSEEIKIKADGKKLLFCPDFTLIPLGISDAIQEKIYALNFLNYVGEPRKTNAGKILKEMARLRRLGFFMGFLNKNINNEEVKNRETYNYFKSISRK